MSIKVLLVFAVTEFLLSLTPGPAVFLVVSQGIKVGFKPSVRGTLGILTGNAIYFALSALGLGALLTTSAALFQAIKYIGAAYLVFIGIKMLISRSEVAQADGQAVPLNRSLRLFWQGLITQLSNPKAIVFFTALLPQFIATNTDMFPQFLLLGVVSIAVEFPVLLAYGWMAERGGEFIPERFTSLPDRIAGVFLIGAGLGLASMRKS
jgi:homoserine/homoserine lactone efflux protein